MWDSIKAWFKDSITILWARVVAVSGIALGIIGVLSADPNFYAALQQAIPPQYWWVLMIAFGAITELARRRTAGK